MKLIIANWKSHKNAQEVVEWLEAFNKSKINNPESKIIMAPPMSLLSVVKDNLPAEASLAVQDISPFPSGKYTGAVCATNLKGLNVKYAIVGHSERRRYFHETHNDIANKVAQCVENNITPIVCVDDEYISTQAAAISQEHLSKCVIAYEDLAAIGTGKNTPLAEVEKAFAEIKRYFGETKLIYGGSVDASNVKDYLDICDGVLVGTASLDVKDFSALV